MMTWLCALLIAIGISLISAPVAQAEFCIASGDSAPTNLRTVVVPKKYSPPTRGTCKPLVGIEVLNFPPRLVAGTVCLNAVGDTLRVAYVVHMDSRLTPPVVRLPLNVSLELPYPSLQSGSSITWDPANPNQREVDVAVAGSCAFPIPIP